jgi:hypothetical protein
MSHPFFSTSLRRDPGQARDLRSRIDAQLVERIEEAVDFVCLDALVESRRAHHLADPVADSAEDRAEFENGVRAFLEHLERSLLPALTPEQRRHVPGAAGTRSELDRLSIQVALAKALPDYWQRFDELRSVYTADTIATGRAAGPSGPAAGPAGPGSGGERRSRLRRLLGGG